MTKLVCRHCGEVQDESEAIREEVPSPSGGKHIKALCRACGKYIKFLCQWHGSPKLYFCKYKDKTVEEIANVDIEYLKWVLANGIGGAKVERAIAELINKSA